MPRADQGARWTETPTVLVAEDELLIALDLEHRLVRHGYLVPQAVASVAAGLTFLRSVRPDVAVLDLTLQDGPVTPLAEALILDPDAQFATALAGHQAKRVSAWMISGMAARVQQRALRAVLRALSVAKCWLATASLVSGHNARPAAARACRTGETPARCRPARPAGH
jgi:two-component system, response regulator PdtaR